MRIGLSAYDLEVTDLVDLARAAEDAGFSSLWLGEHVVLPVAYASAHPTSAGAVPVRPIVDPDTRLIDPLVALGAAAAVTSRIELATGIYLLPLRHPLAVARMVATVQSLAAGRFRFGVGSGWLEEEFAALDVPFAGRGARFDAALDVLRDAFAGGPLRSAGGPFVFDDVQICPRPIDVPLVLGGNTERALRRCALRADGWFSSGNPTFDVAQRCRDQLVEMRAAAGRTDEFTMHVRVPTLDRSAIARYAEAGWDDVVVWAHHLWPAQGSPADKREAFLAGARQLGVHPDRPWSG